MIKSKVLVAVATGLYFAAYFTATKPSTRGLALISCLSLVLFALPSFWYVVQAKGRRDGLQLLAALGLFSLVIESVALSTGFFYGTFTYSDALGNKLFGLTPWTVAFAYPPVLLLAYFVARHFSPAKVFSPMRLAAVTAILATAVDLVLDPAAVRLGFWSWKDPGLYYGVPVTNFLGWLLVSFIGALLLHRLWGAEKPGPAMAYSGMAILWFWTSVNLWQQHWVAGLFGMLLSVFLVRIMKYKTATIRR